MDQHDVRNEVAHRVCPSARSVGGPTGPASSTSSRDIDRNLLWNRETQVELKSAACASAPRWLSQVALLARPTGDHKQ